MADKKTTEEIVINKNKLVGKTMIIIFISYYLLIFSALFHLPNLAFKYASLLEYNGVVPQIVGTAVLILSAIISFGVVEATEKSIKNILNFKLPKFKFPKRKKKKNSWED